MTDEIVEIWLNSKKNAIINSLSLKPVEHKYMKGKPLSSQKGQATVFFLIEGPCPDKGPAGLVKMIFCWLYYGYVQRTILAPHLGCCHDPGCSPADDQDLIM